MRWLATTTAGGGAGQLLADLGHLLGELLGLGPLVVGELGGIGGPPPRSGPCVGLDRRALAVGGPE